MDFQSFIEKFTTEESEQLKKICTDRQYAATAEDANLYLRTIDQASELWGEDLIGEAIRYIFFSAAGLRNTDLSALIGEEWQEPQFEECIRALGFPLVAKEEVLPGVVVYMLPPALALHLRENAKPEERKNFVTDIAFHLLEKPQTDPLREVQTPALLIAGECPYELASYIASAEGRALQIVVANIAEVLREGKEENRECIWQATEVTDFDRTKIFMILLNDVVAALRTPELQRPVIDRLHTIFANALNQQNTPTAAYYLGIAKLRQAQNSRIQCQENEAQQAFVAGISGIINIAKATPKEEVTKQHLEFIWLALKICQEMAQPKAIAALFTELITIENELFVLEGEADAKEEIRERIMMQHIEVSKLYYSMPPQLQEQFTNFTPQTIELLQKTLSETTADYEAIVASGDVEKMHRATSNRATFFQALGELTLQTQQMKESREALTDAQILQERLLGQLTKAEGDEQMSINQLMTRLTLSVTNHLLGIHYRQDKKGRHELSMVLNTNMELAKRCFKFYPGDGRVIHFIINAALELGEFLHVNNSFVPERDLYKYVVETMATAIPNMRLDETLCRDVAMIHSKYGQILIHFKQMKNAKMSVGIAHSLWQQLAQNTKREEFVKNAEAMKKLLDQLN